MRGRVEGAGLTKDDGVSREYGEFRMKLLYLVSTSSEFLNRITTNVEEVQLINGSADGVGEEEDIALQPRHLNRRVLKANAGT